FQILLLFFQHDHLLLHGNPPVPLVGLVSARGNRLPFQEFLVTRQLLLDIFHLPLKFLQVLADSLDGRRIRRFAGCHGIFLIVLVTHDRYLPARLGEIVVRPHFFRSTGGRSARGFRHSRVVWLLSRRIRVIRLRRTRQRPANQQQNQGQKAADHGISRPAGAELVLSNAFYRLKFSRSRCLASSLARFATHHLQRLLGRPYPAVIRVKGPLVD